MSFADHQRELREADRKPANHYDDAAVARGVEALWPIVFGPHGPRTAKNLELAKKIVRAVLASQAKGASDATR